MAKKDYDGLKKVFLARKKGNLDDKLRVKINSLDDVFHNFDLLVNSHPDYFDDNVDVKRYLKSNFKDFLDKALKREDYFVVDEICNRVGKIFVPKNLDYLDRQKEKFGFSYAFKSLINQYELSKMDID